MEWCVCMGPHACVCVCVCMGPHACVCVCVCVCMGPHACVCVMHAFYQWAHFTCSTPPSAPSTADLAASTPKGAARRTAAPPPLPPHVQIVAERNALAASVQESLNAFASGAQPQAHVEEQLR